METRGTGRRALLAGGALAVTAVASGCAAKQPPPVDPKTSISEGPAKAADIPVGGGVILGHGNGVVVTQPEAGVFKAFSAVCTHEGCIVTEVTDGTIFCPCHGSKFRIADGSVAVGPAELPLPPVAVKVADGIITFV